MPFLPGGRYQCVITNGNPGQFHQCFCFRTKCDKLSKKSSKSFSAMYAILSIVSIASRNAHGIGQCPANSRHFMGTANNLCKHEYGFVLEYCGLFFYLQFVSIRGGVNNTAVTRRTRHHLLSLNIANKTSLCRFPTTLGYLASCTAAQQ